MGKSEKARQRKREAKRKARAFRQAPPASTPHTPQKPTFLQRLWKFAKTVNGFLTALVLIFSLIFLPKQCREHYKTEKEKFEDVVYQKGILLPQETVTKFEDLRIQYGTYSELYPLIDFKNGIEIKPNALNLYGQVPFDLKMKLIGNRIYVSATLRYIENSEIVGLIDFQKWRLIKSNFIEYKESDTSLEVIDKKGYINFSLTYQYPNTIKLKGYYPGQNAIYISDDRGFAAIPIDYKKDAEKQIYDNLRVH